MFAVVRFSTLARKRVHIGLLSQEKSTTERLRQHVSDLEEQNESLRLDVIRGSVSECCGLYTFTYAYPTPLAVVHALAE